MKMRALYHVMRADYLERVRTHAFLVTLGFTVYFAYLCLPPNPSSYSTFVVSDRRGVYNSAWVGCLAALLTAAFLSLIGFYLVKNAVDRDRRTGVGQILAATMLPRWAYVVGKWASNWAVLASVGFTVAVCAIGMQLLRGEDRHIDLLAIFLPFLFVTLPALALTAALAILFETTPGLAGGLGNVVYFFLWGPLMFGPSMWNHASGAGISDALGLGTVLPAVLRGVQDAFPQLTPSLFSSNIGLNFRKGGFDLELFRWNGIDWSTALVAPRIAWTLVALAVALIAAIPFDRFDPARAAGARRPASRDDRRRPRLAAGSEAASLPVDEALAPARGLADVVRPTVRESFVAMLVAELRLAWLGTPWPWCLVAAALTLACWVAPLGVAREWILPIAWIWPLLLWSELGARESRYQTSALVFSAPHPLRRQLPAAWLAGVLIAAAMGAGAGSRLAATGDLGGALAWMVGACFAPALAIACGVWTGSGKLFEVLYLTLWYVGPMHRLAPLDFMGAGRASVSQGGPLRFGIATLILLAIAWLGRRRALGPEQARFHS
jgi:hypothetical protein